METEVALAFCIRPEWAGSAGGRRCLLYVGWKDEATQGEREEGGEVNLLQLLRLTILNPSRPGSRGVYGLQIPNICMCVREGKMVTNAIKVSFTSRGASMLGAKLETSSQPLAAIVFRMLRAQCNT